jgi:hypothetical protein
MELFEISLSPINVTRFKATVTESPVDGGKSEELRLPFFEGENDWRITLIKSLESAGFQQEHFNGDGEQDWMVGANILASDRRTFHPSFQANIGKSLYQSLFPRGCKLEQALQTSIRIAEAKNTQLHIQLKFEADVVKRSQLADYPWELLHDGKRFLAHHQVSFSRYIVHNSVLPDLPPVEQVNVLLMSSAACDQKQGLKRLSRHEQQAIRKGLEAAEKAGHIRLAELGYPTLNALRAYLTQCGGNEAPHVLHFDGHGLFGKRCSNQQCRAMHKGIKAERCNVCQMVLPEPQGYLVFEDERGEPDYVSAFQLGTLLQQTRLSDGSNRTGGIALVVLSACQSGMAVAGESIFNGTAQQLIDHRVPAVIAMQYSVSVEGATRFAEQFYRSLGQKNSLSVAVSQGREAMGTEGNQWYRPVLYLRWRDNKGGQLFAPLSTTTDVSVSFQVPSPASNPVLENKKGGFPEFKLNSAAQSERPVLKSQQDILLDEDGTVLASENEDKILPPKRSFDSRWLNELEVPEGAVKLRSKFYVQREGETRWLEQVSGWGETIRVKGAHQMGKSSLLARMYQQAKENGQTSLHLDFQRLDKMSFSTLDSLLRYIATRMAKHWRTSCSPDTYWSSPLGPKDKLSDFLLTEILENAELPILLIFDDVDRVFNHEYRDDFFSLIRAWHNERAYEEQWSKLNIVLAYSTEAFLFIQNLNQSPFNVGLPIELKDFSDYEIEQMNAQHNRMVEPNQLASLIKLLGGHPYLLRMAFYTMATQRINVLELCRIAYNDDGPFAEHLSRYLRQLEDQEELRTAMQDILGKNKCKNNAIFYKLRASGLVLGHSPDAVKPRCGLYAQYFKTRL